MAFPRGVFLGELVLGALPFGRPTVERAFEIGHRQVRQLGAAHRVQHAHILGLIREQLARQDGGGRVVALGFSDISQCQHDAVNLGRIHAPLNIVQM